MRPRALVISLVVVALGLGPGPSAAGSCAGPQLRVADASFAPVPPDSADPKAEPTYHVRVGQPLTVRAENLGPCLDTYSTTQGGCGGQPTPLPPRPSPVAVEDVSLVLEQGARRWRLGTGDSSAPEYVITYAVDLPADLTRGVATLRLQGRTLLGEPSVRLEVS